MAQSKLFNRPLSTDELPACGGIATMFRLPLQKTTEGLDACFVGVPTDIGSGNRNGPRFGPRKIRTESPLVRSFNQETGADPYNSITVADVGDVYCNLFDINQACLDIKKAFTSIVANGCRPIVVGGDRTITYPVLQTLKDRYGPLALIHVDAHTDTYGPMHGSKIWHGSPFRMAVEEGLLDCSKVWQIGIRGSAGSVEEIKWSRRQGFRVIPAYQCWHKSLLPMMAKIREEIGPESPVYFSFDIDSIDPAYAPGTGTPEIGGLTSIQVLEIIRGLRGLNIVGADVAEYSPVHDHDDVTAILAANLLFEILCIVPGVKYVETPFEFKFEI